MTAKENLWSVAFDASLIKLKSNEAGYLAVHIKTRKTGKIVLVNPKGKITGEILLTEDRS